MIYVILVKTFVILSSESLLSFYNLSISDSSNNEAYRFFLDRNNLLNVLAGEILRWCDGMTVSISANICYFLL